MKKLYKSYFGRDPDPRWSWPDEVAQRFDAHSMFAMSAGYYFDTESAEHSEFLDLVQRLRLDIFEEDLIRVSGKEVSDYPYYRLAVKVDTEYEKNEFMDWKSRCPGDERTVCAVGGLQRIKVVLDPNKSKSLDIMELPDQINPHIYIVSRRLKESLHDHGLTGFRTIPCLDDKENGLRQSDLALEDNSAERQAAANRFQLIVTATPERPPHVRRVTIRRRCSSCGTVYLFLGGGTPYFERGEPAEADFQVYRTYQSENEGTFDIAGQICVVSARFIRLMEENRFTGLEKYMKTPPIPHGVIPVC